MYPYFDGKFIPTQQASEIFIHMAGKISSIYQMGI